MTDATGILGIVESQALMTLAIHARRVREGKDLMAALDFARYVMRSGIVTLLNEQGMDGAKLRWMADQLAREVQERFVTNDTSPQLKDEDFRTLHDKLDLIAGFVSRLAPATVAASSPALPSLRVIQGGKAQAS